MARWFTLAALILLLASPAGAQTAPRKFGRGLAGMTTSVLEVPGNMVAESRARGYGEGIPLGFAKGLGMIIPRTLVRECKLAQGCKAQEPDLPCESGTSVRWLGTPPAV